MWPSSLTEKLSIRYPIVQGPFGGGLSSVELTSTVSNLGGLGSFGAQPLSPDEIIQTTQTIRERTDKPFAINLWVSDRDERLKSFTRDDFEKLRKAFEPYFHELKVALPEFPENLGSKYEEQMQALLKARPPVFSFVYGIPSADVLSECRRSGIKTIGTATTVDEALALENAGVDAVVATGFEAGGHRVSFLRSAEESLMGTFSLTPQVADAVKIPVIAAGGIADARGVRAAFQLGADGVQIGTAFLACKESGAIPLHKEKLFSTEARYTTLTKVFTGRLARGLANKLAIEPKILDHLLAPYPMQSMFLSKLREAAIQQKRGDMFMFWSGQSAALLKHKNAGELFASLVDGVEKKF